MLESMEPFLHMALMALIARSLVIRDSVYQQSGQLHDNYYINDFVFY